MRFFCFFFFSLVSLENFELLIMMLYIFVRLLQGEYFYFPCSALSWPFFFFFHSVVRRMLAFLDLSSISFIFSILVSLPYHLKVLSTFSRLCSLCFILQTIVALCVHLDLSFSYENPIPSLADCSILLESVYLALFWVKLSYCQLF